LTSVLTRCLRVGGSTPWRISANSRASIANAHSPLGFVRRVTKLRDVRRYELRIGPLELNEAE
jgi:hypothetical protein